MIAGITRVRNEANIIRTVLDWVSQLVDGIFVYDDCSTDGTAEMCENHPAVCQVVRGDHWDSDPRGRVEAEGVLRQIVYQQALHAGAEWVYYFDGDEILEPDLGGLHRDGGEEIASRVAVEGIVGALTRGGAREVGAPPESSLLLRDLIELHPQWDAFRFRLFDAYITPEDEDKGWTQRRWFGPEYRDILMLFRVSPLIEFHNREPSHIMGKVGLGGWVKHYGKAISVPHWEETCDYYINHRGGDLLPQFTTKWKERKGKAVHDGVSDFGGKLITWDERIEKGTALIDDPSKYKF